jgi:hypothetical protein
MPEPPSSRLARWPSSVLLLAAAALGLDARLARAELVPAFDWSVPARFRVPDLPDPASPSAAATRYFDGPVTPATWRVDLDACATTGPAASFRWALDGVPVLTTAVCGGALLDVGAEGRHQVTLTVSDAAGDSASLTQEIRVEDWLVFGLGDSYGSGEGSPDEPVSAAQIDAVGTARDALAAAEAAAAEKLAAWVLARDDLAVLLPLVNDALARLSAWQAAVDARNDACDNFPPTILLCAEAQAAATEAAARLVVALTALGLESLFGSPTLAGVIANLQTSAEHALSVARTALDAAEAAVAAAGETLAQTLRDLGPRWQDRRCHRSALSGQVQAAKLLEEADPRTSVTFVHLACSGATVWNGLLGGYTGQEPADPALPPQIAAASALAAGRPIDALVVSIGGNDVGFADVIKACVLQLKCFEDPPTTDPAAMAYIADVCAPLGPLAPLCTDYLGGLEAPSESAQSIFLGGGMECGGTVGDDGDALGLDDLPCNYAAVQQELETLRAQGDLHGLFEDDGRMRLYLTAYPGITRREAATPGGPTEPCGFDPMAPAAGRARNLPGIPLPEILWAESFVAPRLAGAMEASAARHGWRFVDGHVGAFDGHGYCADDNWIVRIPESLRAQARVEPLASSFAGSVHPNAAGHREYARAISEALLCDLYPGCTPSAPTTTTTTTSTTTTTNPLECEPPEDCDDGNPCTDDACTAGRCERTNHAGPCDDGNTCTMRDACSGGVCVPGAPVDAAVVASFLTDAAGMPASCRGRKDRRRAQKILKLMTSARKKLAKAASTTGARQGRLLERATAKLEQASGRAAKLEGVLSPGCHAALAEVVGAGRGQASCLR